MEEEHAVPGLPPEWPSLTYGSHRFLGEHVIVTRLLVT